MVSLEKKYNKVNKLSKPNNVTFDYLLKYIL